MKWVAIAIVGVSVIVATPKLRAAEGDGSSPGPLGAVHVEAAARVMGGPEIAPQQFSAAGPLSGGVGARAGASYRGFYGGLSSTYFPGNGSSCVVSLPASCRSDHGVSLGTEVGYGRTYFQLLTIRGLLGVGDYAGSADLTEFTCTSAPCTGATSHPSSHNLYLEPGVLLAITLGPVLIGADSGVLYLPSYTRSGSTASSSFAALMFGLQLGMRL
jgi:hypothetical protein